MHDTIRHYQTIGYCAFACLSPIPRQNIGTLLTSLHAVSMMISFILSMLEFFLNADRKANLTVHYYRYTMISCNGVTEIMLYFTFSPVFQVASWVEDILKCF